MSESNTELWRDEWIPVSQAASEVGTRASKISNLIRNGALQKRENPLDRRETLVQRKAVYELFRKKINPNG